MKLPSRQESTLRLRRIFPAELVEDRVVAGSLAGAAVFVCLYVDAVDGRNKIRPSTVLWMCDAVARRSSVNRRRDWHRAATKSHDAVRALLETWGIDHRPWYAENSRETLRDEVFRAWLRLGAIERDESVATTSSNPAWSLTGDFAALFDGAVRAHRLDALIEGWEDAHLGPVGLTRRAIARRRAQARHAVTVHLPNGGARDLRPGDSSLILKGVVEELALRLMTEPAVLAISESARKVALLDEDLLRDLRLKIDADRLLPDAILFDADSGIFWFVEAVATDGEISETRKQVLLRWAAEQGIAPVACCFITAFLSRTQDVFRRRIASVAWGTLVWFLDEPDKIFRLEELDAPRACVP